MYEAHIKIKFYPSSNFKEGFYGNQSDTEAKRFGFDLSQTWGKINY